MVYSGHLPIVPGDRNRIPTRFGDNATIGGIAPPINAGVLLEGLGFVDCHCCTDAAACIHALPRQGDPNAFEPAAANENVPRKRTS
jgi:hypothetical protein